MADSRLDRLHKYDFTPLGGHVSNKDNQHFVQRAFLNGFTADSNPSELWEYDKKDKCISERIKSTREICSMYQYYAAPGEDGDIDPELIENSFHRIEDPFIRIIRQINPKSDGDKIALSDDNLGTLAYYIGMQLARVPMYRSKIKEFLDGVLDKMAQAVVGQQVSLGAVPDEVILSLKEGNKITVETEEHATIQPMLDTAEAMARSLLKKQWLFLVPHQDIPLIISDNPVKAGVLPGQVIARGPFGQPGPAGHSSTVFMPLRRNLGLIISAPENFGHGTDRLNKENFKVRFLSKGESRDLNSETAKNAMRYVYNGTKNEKLGRMVFKHETRSP